MPKTSTSLAGGESSPSRSMTRTRTTSRQAFLSATAQAQGRTITQQSLEVDLPQEASSKWQRLKQAVPSKASITKLVPQILKEPAGLDVAARRTIFGHARQFLQRNRSEQPEKAMLMIQSVVAGAKNHGQQKGFVTALHENAEEKKQERIERILQEETEQGLQSFDLDLSYQLGALQSSDLLEEAILQAARLKELAEDSEAHETLKQIHETISSCVRMLDDLRAALDMDTQRISDAAELEECKMRVKNLVQDLQCDIDAMMDVIAQARSPQRSPKAKQKFTETAQLASVFCDGAAKLIQFSMVRLDEIFEKGCPSPDEAVQRKAEVLQEECDEPEGPREDAEAASPDEDEEEDDEDEEEEMEAEEAQAQKEEAEEAKEARVEREEAAGAKKAVGQKAVEAVRADEAQEAVEVEAQQPQEAMAEAIEDKSEEEMEEAAEEVREGKETPAHAEMLGSESARSTRKVDQISFHLEDREGASSSEESEASHGAPKSAPRHPSHRPHHLGSRLASQRVPVPSPESPDEGKKAVEGAWETDDIRIGPRKRKKPKKAKPKPVVKTRIEILPPVRLPCLSWSRNRKNTADLDWTMEDLNADELTLLTSVIDEDEPYNSHQSVSHDPAKERLWRSVFGLDDASSAASVPRALQLPQLLPKSGPDSPQTPSKHKHLAHLVDHPQTPRTPRSPCRQAKLS